MFCCAFSETLKMMLPKKYYLISFNVCIMHSNLIKLYLLNIHVRILSALNVVSSIVKKEKIKNMLLNEICTKYFSQSLLP